MTYTFLGYPPSHIMKWIEKQPASDQPDPVDTRIVFSDGTEWTGDLKTADFTGYIPDPSSIFGYKRIDDSATEFHLGTGTDPILTAVSNLGSSIYGGGFSNLRIIEIPKTVTKIGEYAFSNLSSIERIDLPDSVVEIDSSFVYGSDVKSIRFSNQLSSIEFKTCLSCTKLSSVHLPDNLKKIERQAF